MAKRSGPASSIRDGPHQAAIPLPRRYPSSASPSFAPEVSMEHYPQEVVLRGGFAMSASMCALSDSRARLRA